MNNNKAKIMRYLNSTIFLLHITLLLSTAAYAEETVRGLKLVGSHTDTPLLSRHALVIGNANYKNSPLKNPVNDANDIAQTLQGLGFEVTLLLDANLKDTILQVRDFKKKLSETQGIGLFFYAGHGMQIKGKNYLIPIEASILDEYQVTYEGLDVGRVLQGMEEAGNHMNIVILDACRDNPFARSFRSGAKGLAQLDAPSGTLIAYATAPGSVSIDSDTANGRNGLYTKHLLRQINTDNLPIETVLKRVRQGVMNETGERQVPWESSSLVGEFCFSGSCAGDDKQYSLNSHTQPVMSVNNPVRHNFKQSKPWYKRWYTWAAAAVATAVIISCSGGGDGGTADQGGDGGGCSF